VANQYTELEHQLALLKNDLEWLVRLEDLHQKLELVTQMLTRWLSRLEAWKRSGMDERERQLLV
jgi:hypothetical protein